MHRSARNSGTKARNSCGSVDPGCPHRGSGHCPEFISGTCRDSPPEYCPQGGLVLGSRPGTGRQRHRGRKASAPVLSAAPGVIGGAATGCGCRNTAIFRQRTNQPREAVTQWMSLTQQLAAVRPDRATTIGTLTVLLSKANGGSKNVQGGLRGTGHDDDFLNVPHHEHSGRVSLRRVNRPTA